MNSKVYVDTVPEETLEERMIRLCELKKAYREEKKVFKEKTKNTLDMIKILENIISAEVIKMGHTVQTEGIKAEYVPQVVIRLKKEQNND